MVCRSSRPFSPSDLAPPRRTPTILSGVVLKFTDYRLVMRRGLRRCCPQCGLTKLFTGWYDLRSRCPVCELDLRIHDQNTWAFMYLSTAVLTGLIVIGMLLIIPGNQWMGRAVVLVVAIGAIIGTLPLRK